MDFLPLLLQGLHQLVSRAIQAFGASILLVWVRFFVHTCLLFQFPFCLSSPLFSSLLLLFFSCFWCYPPFDIEATWISIDSSGSTPWFIGANMFLGSIFVFPALVLWFLSFLHFYSVNSVLLCILSFQLCLSHVLCFVCALIHLFHHFISLLTDLIEFLSHISQPKHYYSCLILVHNQVL